jgi:integrase/recombinase XerC
METASDSVINDFLRYLRAEKRYSAHTLLAYQTDLHQFHSFVQQTSGASWTEVTAMEVRSWMASLIHSGQSARSVNRKISALKSLYKYLMRSGIIADHPLKKIQTPKMPRRLPVYVEQRQMEQIQDQAELIFSEGYTGQLEKIVIDLLYATGIRRAELIGLREVAVDMFRAQIKVLGKGNKERIIPVHPDLVDQFKAYKRIRPLPGEKAGGCFLLDEKGNALSPSRVYQITRKCLSQVTTMDKKSPHVLRHTFATHLMNRGADINAVKELLGHASLAATQVYTHNTIEKLKDIHRQAHPKS